MAVVNYPLRCFGAYGNRDMNFSPKRDDMQNWMDERLLWF